MTSIQTWHDETERWARTGRLDQGPCWCSECLNRAEIEQYLNDHAIPWPTTYTSDEEQG